MSVLATDRRPSRFGAGLAAIGLILLVSPSVDARDGGPTFGAVARLVGAAGGTEPQIAIAATGRRWLVTNAAKSGAEIVYSSIDHGRNWIRTPSDPVGQDQPTIDVDIVTTRTGRILTTELDALGLNLRVAFSDDQGRTWTASRGTALIDQDRQWLGVGTDDPITHQPRVYLYYHNLFGGVAAHNMFVMTSRDGGASFGLPVPITLPGSQAFLDLQCADSGGPDGMEVNPANGRIYAYWGTRSSTIGGCGARPLEANIVGQTREWIATSPDGSLGSWTTTIAVDDSVSGQIVGMQGAAGTLDNKGNFWLAYPESPHPYPDYDGAPIRVRWAPPDLSHWSTPITIVEGGEAGNVLPSIVAGDLGRIDVSYFAGIARGSKKPAWYLTVAQSLDATSASPHIDRERVSPIPTYTGTASELMGACAPNGPTAGIQNGLRCGRATDVWGSALDEDCLLTVTWPAVANDAPGAAAGTYVATQTSGPILCGRTVGVPIRTRVRAVKVARLPATGVRGSPTGIALLVIALLFTLEIRRTGSV
jgi:hypothetical protein